MAEPGRARLSVGPDEHCLICNVNIKTPGFSCRNIYDIDHQVESTSSDNHQGALRIRLEQLLQVSLTEALCHSSLVCEACEKKVSQIEDYYRLVAEFESTFYQTARQYGITDQTLEINRLPSKRPWEFPTSVIPAHGWWWIEEDITTKPLLGDPLSSQKNPETCDGPGSPVVPKVEVSLGDHSETGVSSERSGGVDSCEDGGHQPGDEEDGARETHGASGDMERNNREDQVTQSEKMPSEDRQIKDEEQTEDDGDVRGDGSIGCRGNMACGVLCNVSPENKWTLRQFLTSEQPLQEKLKTPVQTKQKSQQETLIKTLPSKRSPAMHKKSQQSSDSKKHQCSICQRKFASEEQRNAHEVKCRKECEQLNLSMDRDADKPYTCIICATSYTTKGSLKRHVSIKHMGEKPQREFKCHVCSKTYSHSGSLSNHMAQHARKHICSVCDRAFPGSSKLKEHMRIHTGDRPYACKSCSKTFTKAALLKSHMVLHMRPYKCSQCPKTFQFDRLLIEHVRTHTGEKRHLCSVCGKSFLRPKQLKSHLRRHTGEKPYTKGIPPKAFKCVVCSKVFGCAGTLSKHMTRHARKYVCSVCNRACTGSYNLKVHMRIHTGDRPYACKSCTMTFTEASYLRKHMSCHDGIKRFLCATCGRQFVYRNTLRRHMVSSHTELRPYKCNQCPKAFQLEGILKEHLQIHTGEKPHLCSICGKSFLRPQQLKSHFRIHTGEKPYNCNICGAKFRHQSSFNQHTRSSHCDISFSLPLTIFVNGSEKQKKGHAQQEIVAGGSGIGSTGVAAGDAVTVESGRVTPLLYLSM